MSSPSKILWDEQETAILVHAYVQFKAGLLFRNEAIQQVSNTLRNRALQKGMDIDEHFRNENVITMQMLKIEDLFTEETFRLSDPTMVLFINVVNLYKKNRNAFNELLQQAIGTSPATSSLEDDFYQWLSTKVPTPSLPKLKNACRNLEDFLIKYKVLDISLFDMSILDVIDKVKTAVVSNEILHFIHQKQMPLIQTAVEFYYIYLNESQDASTEMHRPENITHQEPAPRIPPTHNIVDFTEIKTEQYANTLPEQLYYNDEPYYVRTWNKLYTIIARCIYKEHPESIKKLIGKSFSGEGKRVDLCDISLKPKMKFPKEIADGLYLETHLSATNTVRKIKALLDLCNIDYKVVTITYSPVGHVSLCDTDIPTIPKDLAPLYESPSAPGLHSAPEQDLESPLQEEDATPPALVSITSYAFAGCPPEAYTKSYHVPLQSVCLHFDAICDASIPTVYAASRSNLGGQIL